jgi:hypothetical protein
MRRAFDSVRTFLARVRTRARETIQIAGQARRAHALARNLHWAVCMLSLCLPLYAAEPTHAQERVVFPQPAQERVLLQEIMPELAGSPLGAVDVAAAPALGASLLLRKNDVLRALIQAGASAKGLTIPRSIRITRELTSLAHAELSLQAQAALEHAVAPCELREARFPNLVRIARGARSFHAEFPNGLRNGQITGTVIIESGGHSARVPVVASLVCPLPAISAGMQVTARAVVGQVTASAPAEARQPGRVGEVIRITNRATGASLRARVLDAHTVEIVP